MPQSEQSLRIIEIDERIPWLKSQWKELTQHGTVESDKEAERVNHLITNLLAERVNLVLDAKCSSQEPETVKTSPEEAFVKDVSDGLKESESDESFTERIQSWATSNEEDDQVLQDTCDQLGIEL